MSALTPINVVLVDVRFTPRSRLAEVEEHVRFVPKADPCTAAINARLRTDIA